MKIPAINPAINYYKQIKSEQKQKNTQDTTTKPMELRAQFNDYLITFEARVDKGMNRFFNTNKDRMPERVRALVEPMPNRELITPLEAQYYAYQELKDANTIDDVKNAYSDEFETLKDVSQSEAKTGIIYKINEMSEVYPDGVLQTKENFTVYLVKKIYLESKTIDEINKDLDEDLDKDFKIYYRDKYADSPFVRSSTLNALGIKMPNSKYMQSLRYTRDGYSDLIGAKIRKGLNEFMASLTPEQRTARAVRKTREYEKWWNTLTRDEKIEMIAEREAEIEMLKAFKKNQRLEAKRLKEAGIEIEDNDNIENSKPKSHTRVGSKELSNDELFKMWAGLSLKKFKESMSQAELDTFHLRQMVNQTRRWKEMSATERTDYISKMKAGAEPVRFTMIDAWNNSPEIIKALYLHLKENQVYKPADLLYSTDEFSQFQSKVMTEFWDNNPDFSEQLGSRIHKSREKVESAIKNGTFEALKHEINRNKNWRKRELEAYKKSLDIPTVTPKVESPELDYKDEFRQAYAQSILGQINSTPKNYFADVYERGLDILPKNIVQIWTRILKQDKTLTQNEIMIVKEALNFRNTKEIMIYNHAFETAIADCLYTATKEPLVFGLNATHIKSAIYQLERGENPIRITDAEVEEDFVINVDKKHKHIDKARINQLYETYKKELSEDDIKNIINYNFSFDDSTEEKRAKIVPLKNSLAEYIKTYGRSINIIFSEKSAYPATVKSAFAKQFMANMPPELRNSDLFHAYGLDSELNQKFEHAKTIYGHKFPFLPKDIIDSYFKELKVKKDDRFNIEEFMIKCCKKRRTSSDRSSIAIIPKHTILQEKVKYQMLAIEQAMADVLYSATGNETVYKMGFETLCDKLELFSLVRKFPTENSQSIAVDGTSVDLILKNRLNLASVQKKYKEYMKEISEWIEETKNSKPNYQDLLYILSPEEGNPIKDLNVGERMATYFPDLSELDFSSNDFGPAIKFKTKPTSK